MKNKNFLLLITGRVFTNIGDSLYAVASMWLVFDLTHSSFFTGLAGFLTLAPVVLQFVIGPFIDNTGHKSILIYSQMIQAILLMIIPVAYFFDVLNPWMVLIISPIASMIQQFVYPTQSAMLPNIVEKEYLTKANSWMNATYQLLDVILLGVSGLIIATIGVISVYLLNSVAFFIAMTLFLYLKVPTTGRSENYDTNHTFTFKEKWIEYKVNLRGGYDFIRNSFIPKFLVASILANFIIGAVSAILPEYAAERGGSHVYGWYLGGMSAGLFVGAIVATYFRRFPLGKVTIIGFLCSGISWLLSGLTNITLLSVVLYGVSYIVIGITNVLFLSSLQTVIPEKFLGRVFSVIVGATSIAAPIGALIGGILATFTGSSVVFLFGSVGVSFISIYWLMVPTLRRLPKPDSLEKEGLLTVKIQ